jgi:hypothetical protein
MFIRKILQENGKLKLKCGMKKCKQVHEFNERDSLREFFHFCRDARLYTT